MAGLEFFFVTDAVDSARKSPPCGVATVPKFRRSARSLECALVSSRAARY